MKNKKNSVSQDKKSMKFGTFGGVFTPSILTILGVIMYLRFGWVVGNGGLIGAVLVVLLAHVISITAGMSVSSIATNRTVKAGGDYYMISRSLGLPIGGAIGLALFFALALSTSLYILGFAESFLESFGFTNDLFHRRIVGSIACLGLTVVTFISTSLALRIQYIVLIAIVLSLVSLFMGTGPVTPLSEVPLWFSKGSESFEVLFAVFFPAVTGFTAGVAMSGDLKDPRKSIPLGTMGAIIVGLLVYLAIPVFLSMKVDPEALKTDQMVWMSVARFPSLIIAGVFAATVSSALGSILGAPRYLQALAMDRVVPRFLGKGYGPLNEPRIGTVITFVVAEGGILIGELDMIARVITMFFLSSYGFICLASGIQKWSGIASYRPEFKTPTSVSFIGAVACLGIMFKLDMVAMIGATFAMLAVYWILQRRNFKSSPKDTWAGFWAAVVQKGLLKLHKNRRNSKNWRPNAIVFAGEPSERQHLINLTKWMVDTRGLATYFYLIEGDILLESKRADRLEPGVRETVGRLYPDMLTQVAVANDIYEGIINASQSYGLSGMKPNTVIMGWGDESESPAKFTNLVHSLMALDHNLIFVNYDENREFGYYEKIDIWWGGMNKNGDLMLLLGYLILSSEQWRKARINIYVVVDEENQKHNATESLTRIIEDSRVKATAKVIVRESKDKKISTIMSEVSGESDLVIMGLREPKSDEAETFIEYVSGYTESLGTVMLVHSSTKFEGASVLFDEE